MWGSRKRAVSERRSGTRRLRARPVEVRRTLTPATASERTRRTVAKNILWYSSQASAARSVSNVRSRTWLFTCRNFVGLLKILRVFTEAVEVQTR